MLEMERKEMVNEGRLGCMWELENNGVEVGKKVREGNRAMICSECGEERMIF